MRTIGIDPGQKGAIVLLDTEKSLVRAFNLPITSEKHKSVTKNVLDATAFERILVECRAVDARVFFEDVFSMPHDGHVGAFSFGVNKGALLAVLALHRCSVSFVAPSKWKRDLGCTADKSQTKRVCQRLFPDAKKELSNEGKREAALIALWGLLTSPGYTPTRGGRFQASTGPL
jgi:hypothetical protein